VIRVGAAGNTVFSRFHPMEHEYGYAGVKEAACDRRDRATRQQRYQQFFYDTLHLLAL
jgi:hypothetical protein